MTEPAAPRTKSCPSCGQLFPCHPGGCWCGTLKLSVDTLNRLRQTHGDCLCEACLRKLEAPRVRILLSWSSGKDCAMALHELRKSNEYEVVALLTTLSEEYRRISHHGVREELVDAQAAAIGLPVEKVYLPSNGARPCTNEVYEALLEEVLRKYMAKGAAGVAFGDLFLEDLRAWRENNLAKLGLKGVFPLWKRDTAALARDMIGAGFKGHLSCVEGKVGSGFAGRAFDESLLNDLPAGVDPCGENGEFHTFVHDGPIFRAAVDVRVGQTVMRDGRYYADLLPGSAAEVPQEALAAAIPPVM